MNEEDLMLMIFQNLPPEYKNTVEILEIEFENGETDLQKVKERLKNRFNKLEKNKKIIENEKELNANEKALAMKQGGFNKQYKKQCSNCGVYGYKGYECPNREDQNGKKQNEREENTYRFPGRCPICNKIGHKKWYCPERKTKETTNFSKEEEVVLMGTERDVSDPNVWICDSGATCHMIGNDLGLINTKRIDHQITVGDGRCIKTSKMGDLKLEIMQKEGRNVILTLKDVKVVEVLKFNLFCVSCAIKMGAIMRTEGSNLVVEKAGIKIKFDENINVGNGFLMSFKAKLRKIML